VKHFINILFVFISTRFYQSRGGVGLADCEL